SRPPRQPRPARSLSDGAPGRALLSLPLPRGSGLPGSPREFSFVGVLGESVLGWLSGCWMVDRKAKGCIGLSASKEETGVRIGNRETNANAGAAGSRGLMAGASFGPARPAPSTV